MLFCKSIEVVLYVFLFVVFAKRYVNDKNGNKGYSTRLPLLTTLLVIL